MSICIFLKLFYNVTGVTIKVTGVTCLINSELSTLLRRFRKLFCSSGYSRNQFLSEMCKTTYFPLVLHQGLSKLLKFDGFECMPHHFHPQQNFYSHY